MISAPVDYGLSPAQTLAHEIDPTLPPEFADAFDAHWAAFREALASLPTRWQGHIDSPTNQVVIRSLGSVRIAARVSLPDDSARVRGIVVTSHGYADVPDTFGEDAEPWTGQDLATVRVRVRGYPPSTADMPDLRGEWIMHRLPLTQEVADAWVVRGAVADIVQAVQCARAHFGDAVPVTLHGESLGGGLATIAAAQLTRLRQPPSRLIVGLPSLGDWRWRAAWYCNGLGAPINMLLDALRGEDRERFLIGLLLYDAALHAKAVAAPTLAKLAVCDDVVPAPSAAAVFNALASPERWRFVTRFGHFDGGIGDARRQLLFERIHPSFADPALTPMQALAEHVRLFELPGRDPSGPEVTVPQMRASNWPGRPARNS